MSASELESMLDSLECWGSIYTITHIRKDQIRITSANRLRDVMIILYNCSCIVFLLIGDGVMMQAYQPWKKVWNLRMAVPRKY